ncbi:DUF6355 family natural product biosynthesis protein [Crossiella sp. SN42]|uniref:DUF6355 family natural product biosynthesis protein n=1 Tax=Crossiella sp. SN42 TaxID=2944808 RepID=UPI00207C916E|nr:DUF6355 family natural product biosynthesis protein [Crossiella sp. SN42]MCO1575162.1 DUF6355 family natural product biosynthesis protein [Crossiella sp. SN42]
MRAAVIAAVAAIGLAVGSTTAVAAGLDTTSTCGFWENSKDSYYRHCTSNGTRIIIRVDYHGGGGRFQCIREQNTDVWLGAADDIRNAYYTGRLC